MVENEPKSILIMHMTSQIPNNMQTNQKNITIGTWNLCLGLRNKKDYVSKIINENKLDIVCLQETDIEPNYPIDILSFKGWWFGFLSFFAHQGLPLQKKSWWRRDSIPQPSNLRLTTQTTGPRCPAPFFILTIPKLYLQFPQTFDFNNLQRP